MLRQEKITKRRRPTRTGPSGFPRFSEKIGRLRNSRCALRQSSPTSPDFFGNPRRCRGDFKERAVTRLRVAMFWSVRATPGQGFEVAFGGSPFPPPSSTAEPGAVGEDCLSAKREFRSRPAWRATQGTRSVAEGGGMGSPSLGYLSWRSKKGNQPAGLPPAIIKRCARRTLQGRPIYRQRP